MLDAWTKSSIKAIVKKNRKKTKAVGDISQEEELAAIVQLEKYMWMRVKWDVGYTVAFVLLVLGLIAFAGLSTGAMLAFFGGVLPLIGINHINKYSKVRKLLLSRQAQMLGK